MDIIYSGLDTDELARALSTGVDHTGSRIVPFVDSKGQWPLRCCLTTSEPGDFVAIIGFSNFPWTSPVRGTGPVVVHTDGCPGPSGNFPAQFEDRDQIIRAYGTDAGRAHVLIYDLNRLVRCGDGLEAAIEEVLADGRVEFVHAHNVLAGCYSFTASRPAS